MSGIVAIIGRPNVGKSTLFNRFTESQEAIVDEVSGVTRDRHYGKVTWNGVEFSIIDTGGYVVNSGDVFENEIKRQVSLAIDECDVVLFLTDVYTGITDLDDSVAKLLHRSKKKVMLVVNKVDNNDQYTNATEFYSLGLGDYFCISSMSGSGTGDLLDEIVKQLPVEIIDEEELKIPKIAVVGRPNVGKSSLANALLGEERNIVTPIAGTTRDSIVTRYNKFGHDIFFIDTAGLRKRSKVHEDIEFYSTLRTIRAIETCTGMEAQDQTIMDLIARNHKGVVLCVNKWDLAEKSNNTAHEYEEALKEKLAPYNNIPIIFTSVLNKQRIHKVLEKAIEVHQNLNRRITTSALNDFMQTVIEAYPPPSNKGKYIRIKYVTQLPTRWPAIAFFAGNAKYIQESYKRYLENKLREQFNFEGVPVTIYFREK